MIFFYLTQRSGRQKLAAIRAALAFPAPAAFTAVGRPPPRRAPRAPGVGDQLALGGDAAGAVIVAFLAGLQDPVAAGWLVRLVQASGTHKDDDGLASSGANTTRTLQGLLSHGGNIHVVVRSAFLGTSRLGRRLTSTEQQVRSSHPEANVALNTPKPPQKRMV